MPQDKSSSSSRGFTLIETLAAVVIGLAVVLGLGLLSERLVHHRVSTDSNSAAASLAERQVERMFADPTPNPELISPNPCTDPNSYDLCGGTHTAVRMDANGTVNGSGVYELRWVVVNVSSSASSPLIFPSSVSSTVKQITVTARHVNDPLIYAQVVSYYRLP